MSDERFIFKQVMEGLFLVGLRERVTPEVRAELKALGTVISVGEIMGAKNMRGRVLSYTEPSAVFLAEWD